MYLVYDPFSIPDRVFFRKVAERLPSGQLRIRHQGPAVPFNELTEADVLTTADLCYLFGCSARTLYRWINERALRPRGQVGRELLFTKSDVVKWFRNHRPPGPGRPKLA